MDRVQKKDSVEQLEGWFNEAASVVVVHYRGLTVEEVTNLRRKAHANDVGIKVAKNSLAKIAAEKTAYKGIKDLLKGPTALVFSKDAVAPAKTIVDFAKKNEKVVIIGGALGDKVLDDVIGDVVEELDLTFHKVPKLMFKLSHFGLNGDLYLF